MGREAKTRNARSPGLADRQQLHPQRRRIPCLPACVLGYGGPFLHLQMVVSSDLFAPTFPFLPCGLDKLVTMWPSLVQPSGSKADSAGFGRLGGIGRWLYWNSATGLSHSLRIAIGFVTHHVCGLRQQICRKTKGGKTCLAGLFCNAEAGTPRARRVSMHDLSAAGGNSVGLRKKCEVWVVRLVRRRFAYDLNSIRKARCTIHLEKPSQTAVRFVRCPFVTVQCNSMTPTTHNGGGGT